MKIKILFYLLVPVLSGCGTIKIPKVKLSQFPPDAITASYTVEDRKVNINFQNNLHSPVRIGVHSEDTIVMNYFRKGNPVILGTEKDTSFQILLPSTYDPKITFSSALGDPSKQINLITISLPVKKDVPVRIIQGYNDSYSHNKEYSRYALDFDIKENDTIYASTNGVVIGVIRDYIHGGPGDKWRGYDNFITIYDPVTGLYTQYAHLVYQGNLVSIGDKVKRGDPVALAGKTGFAYEAHLHFNTLVPVAGGDLISVPVNFIEGYKGEELHRGHKVIRP